MEDLLTIIFRVLPEDKKHTLVVDRRTTIRKLFQTVKNSVGEFSENEINDYLVFNPKNEEIENLDKTLEELNVSNNSTINLLPKILDDKDKTINIVVNGNLSDSEMKMQIPRTTSGKILKEIIINKWGLDILTNQLSLTNYDNSKIIMDEDILDSDDIVIENDLIIFHYFKEESDDDTVNLDYEEDIRRIIFALGIEESANIEAIIEEINRLIEASNSKKELQDVVNKWYEDISNAKCSQVIKELMRYNKVNNFHDQSSIINLSARWNLVHKQNIEGIISYDEFMREINKLNSAIYSIILEIEDSYIN